MSGNWWLTDGEGVAFGPYFRREIDTRFKRYRHYRRHSCATRRACWRKAGEFKFASSEGADPGVR